MRIGTGLRLLGLSALVMGVMAIGTAAVANAEAGSAWCYINPSNQQLKCFDGVLRPGLKNEFENNKMTFLISNVNLEISCTGGAFIEGGQLTSNGTISTGRMEFNGCTAWSKTPTLSKLNSCTPSSAGGAGTIISEKAHGLIRLHNSTPAILILPAEGTVLTKIFLGEECAVSEELIVNGHWVIADCGGASAFKTHQVKHLFAEFAELRMLKVGVNAASIDGSFWLSLTGTHAGYAWAGLPI